MFHRNVYYFVLSLFFYLPIFDVIKGKIGKCVIIYTYDNNNNNNSDSNTHNHIVVI